MLKKILLGVLVLVALLLVAIVTRPDTYRVERSVTIAAPADIPFGMVNDFRNWNRWSPFDKLDSNMTRTIGGTPAGVGASYSWIGNMQAGTGTMTIRESTPPQHIAVALDFTKPFKSSSVAEFAFTPSLDGGTTVTWIMSGPSNIMSKTMEVFSSMDKMMGPQFQEGLNSLKAISEAEAKVRASTPAPTVDSTNGALAPPKR